MHARFRSHHQQPGFALHFYSSVVPSVFPSAFALDLLGFDVYTFPLGAAGALSFHDPLEGTETSGNVKLKIAPPPSRFSAQMRPPCASTSPLDTASPSPEPVVLIPVSSTR